MMRISLNGKWKCRPDIKNEGINNKWFLRENVNFNDPSLLEIIIPNSFNILKNFELYEGIFWHFYTFDLENGINNKSFDYFLKFYGANYITKVWLNGSYIGEFEGGFVPFRFKVNNFLKSSNNFLVVWVDNKRRESQIPDVAIDWFNWGGIYRDVELEILEKDRIEDVVIKTTVKSNRESKIEIKYKISGQTPLYWEIFEFEKENPLFFGNISETSGEGCFSLTISNPKLWSPESPNLYILKIYNNPNIQERSLLFESTFGIRQIEVIGKYLYLNKKRIYLKGISLHEELMPYGRTIPHELRERDLKDIKSLGLNAVRTTHYPHDESLVKIADRIGLLILEEIPVYWHCNFKSVKTFKIAARMIKNLIKRDINHPSVIWWSVGNEIPIELPECAKFINRLMEWVRRFDDTRIITFVSNKLFCDLVKRNADVGAINLYFGWYYGSPKMISPVLDIFHVPIFDKPIVYTEFGAGAKYGYHKEWELQEKFSEERQLYVLDYTIKTLNSLEYVAGWFIWVYRDFRAYMRQNKFQQGFNRKGIVSEKNEKKLIYYRIPKIINEKRKIRHFRLLSVLLWIILFPLDFIFSYILEIFIKIGSKKGVQKGLEKERKRLEKEGKIF
ncbi:MAG: glycoside hydrolase family 2 protein [Promethearchaeota archaeon]